MLILKNFTVAIDGPAGSGKSTIAKQIAKKYNFLYLDTGAMYRAITYYFLQNNIDIKNKNEVLNALEKIKISFDKENNCMLNGTDVSKEIRTKNVNNFVSQVSSIVEIREAMVKLQREIASKTSSVLDGRDIGSVVLPNANLKIFLTASVEERAKRRYEEEKSKGIATNFETVLENIKERDYIDTTKKFGALKKVDDAILIDTTNIPIDKVIEKICLELNKKYDRK